MPRSPKRPLILTERVRRLCRLSPADVAFLAAHYPTHFELRPTGRRDFYELIPGGVVGILATPTRRLIIRPKIPLANLFYLLDPFGTYANRAEDSTPADGREALNFLAGQFAIQLHERVEAGLQRGYSERAITGPYLLGRLDVAAQMRDGAAHKEQLHCRHDAFTTDVPCNRVVRSVAETLLSSPLLRDEIRAALQPPLCGFADVQPIPLTPDVWADLDPAPTAYRPLLDLGRLLADSLKPGGPAGAIPGPAFLLNLQQVFELFITRLLTRAVESEKRLRARVHVVPQPLRRVSVPKAGQPDLLVRPDVLLQRDGAAWRLVDAKWKRLGPTPLLTADIYQMLAYCSALDVRRAVLVYPGSRDRLWSYDLERGGCRILVYRLRVVGDGAALNRSTRRLTRCLLR